MDQAAHRGGPGLAAGRHRRADRGGERRGDGRCQMPVRHRLPGGYHQAQPHRDRVRPGGRRHPGRTGDQRRVQHRHDPHHADRDAAPVRRPGRQGGPPRRPGAGRREHRRRRILAGRAGLPARPRLHPRARLPARVPGRRADAARRRRLGPVPRADRPAQPRHRHRRAGLRRRHRRRPRAALPLSDHPFRRGRRPGLVPPPRAVRADECRAHHPGHHRPAGSADQPLGWPRRARRLGRGRYADRRPAIAVARRVNGTLVSHGGMAVSARPPWLVRRLFPLLATVVMAAVGMAGTIWGPRYYGKTAWALPDDLWGTLIAAQRIAHLNLGGLYTAPTQLVSLPGAAMILVPAVAVIDATGLRLSVPHAHGAYPSLWYFAGPYQVAISAVTLFAADAIAERLGASRLKRFLLAAAGATALWSVTVRWGHPEDAVAVGLLLYAILALAGSRTSRSAWLAGAAVAVQPLVLLAFPLLAAAVEPRRLAGYVARAAAPAALLLGVAAANWPATVHAITSQPTSPIIDHPTPWISLAPHMPGGQVAAGPARILAIV